MLLAEANQWPSDVRPYFGDGDECHMAFHFPLMPRMFMALRQEDRHAITEILSQTPEIPPTSQWALFLRNHDELTLEMVTDEERDYMYTAYAADPQTRLNLGIRRRLAPLVENSRRRVELLNSMLFSLPGTPVIYYGDEIGMGDNVYLGDRNGVRTPMQWSSDRNGGFSRADTARLFAPPIQDPVYGYQAINVEAQERYPFSQLNFMKRLIAMRKQHRVFGRGSLEFVGCSNRKIFAYLRRDERETILCVVNLSRSVQPAELELQAFANQIPIEMTGLTEFPRIEGGPYFLTLGPYSFYWFALQSEPVQRTPRVAATRDSNAAIAEELPALMVGADWQNILDGATRTILEQRALVPYLQRQRWFASKARQVRRARFTDWSRLRTGKLPSFLTVVSLEYTDSWTESYFVPLTLVSDEEARAILSARPAAVMARITGARKGGLVDGFHDDETCDRILDVIGKGTELSSTRGGVRGGVIDRSAGVSLNGDRRWARPGGDQSNSVAFVNDALVLKLFRRIEPDINPEFEIGRFLTERHFARTPPLGGALEYLRPGLAPGTLAIVQASVKHQGTGWDFAMGELSRFYERVTARSARTVEGREQAPATEVAQGASPSSALPGPPVPSAAPAPFFSALTTYAVQSADTLGKRTAELHATLAGGTSDAFVPEVIDRAALDALVTGMVRNAENSLDMLRRRFDTLNDASREPAGAVLAAAEAVKARLNRLRAVNHTGWRIRVHGDYHLGQVLRTEEDFMVLDFEGEPDRSIKERRAKQSPVKDVAGMVRSFGYAAYAALFAFTLHAPDTYPALEPWADAWQRAAADAFVNGYLTTVKLNRADPASGRLVPDVVSWNAMLRGFVLDKALYELAYELNHRPEWVRIPLLSIRKLVE
jgi:maltose alpha-D-glucosyltransferase/alpha-amylase